MCIKELEIDPIKSPLRASLKSLEYTEGQKRFEEQKAIAIATVSDCVSLFRSGNKLLVEITKDAIQEELNMALEKLAKVEALLASKKAKLES